MMDPVKIKMYTIHREYEMRQTGYSITQYNDIYENSTALDHSINLLADEYNKFGNFEKTISFVKSNNYSVEFLIHLEQELTRG